MIEYVNVLILEETFLAFPNHIKNSILNASVSKCFSDIITVTLSGKNYKWIEAEKSLAMQTELKYFEFILPSMIQNIISSGEYTSKPFTPELLDEYKRVRFGGEYSIATIAGETKYQDFIIPEMTYKTLPAPIVFTGIKYGIDGGNFGDTVSLSVVDVAGYLGQGPNYLIEEFATGFFVFPNEIATIKEHRANTFTGFSIRITYKNNGAQTAHFYGNLLKYIDTTKIET